MKLLIPLGALLALFPLSSCNTLIGVGRDTKEGFIWTKNKIIIFNLNLRMAMIPFHHILTY